MSHGYETAHDIPHWLYAYWRADGRLLYVGVTHDPQERHNAHIHASAWFGEAERFQLLLELPNGREAYKAEKVYIEIGRPLYNLKHNPANKHIKLPYGTWMLPPARVSLAVYEAVNASAA
jgi:hypothetical protein